MNTQEEELKARYEQLGKALLETYSNMVEVLVPVVKVVYIKVMRPHYLRQRYRGFFEKVGDRRE